MTLEELDYPGRPITRVTISIIRQSGLGITYNLQEDSEEWKKNISKIVEAIRDTWGLSYEDSDRVHGMVLDAMYTYKTISSLP
jgi:hypothetical protein